MHSDEFFRDLRALYETVQFEIYARLLECFEVENSPILKDALTNIAIHYKNKIYLEESDYKEEALMKELLKHANSEIERLCNLFPDINHIYDMHTELNPKALLDVILNEIKTGKRIQRTSGVYILFIYIKSDI